MECVEVDLCGEEAQNIVAFLDPQMRNSCLHTGMTDIKEIVRDEMY